MIQKEWSTWTTLIQLGKEADMTAAEQCVKEEYPKVTTILEPPASSDEYSYRTWRFLWEDPTKISIVEIVREVRVKDCTGEFWTVHGSVAKSTDEYASTVEGDERVFISKEEFERRIASKELKKRTWQTKSRKGICIEKGKMRLYGCNKGKFYSLKPEEICVGGGRADFDQLQDAFEKLCERCGLPDPHLSIKERLTQQVYPRVKAMIRDGVRNPMALSHMLDLKNVPAEVSLKETWDKLGIRGKAAQAIANVTLKDQHRFQNLCRIRMACTAGLEPKDIKLKEEGDKSRNFADWSDYSWMREMSIESRRRIVAEPYGDLSRMVKIVKEAGYELPKTCINGKYLHDQLTALVNAMGDTHQAMPIFQSWERIHGKMVEGYEIKVPRCSHELRAWGRTLRHCIASYYEMMAKGDCLLVSFWKEDRVQYCAEVTKGKVVQLRGERNCDAPQELQKAFETLVKSLNINLPGKKTEGYCSESDKVLKLNAEAIYAEEELACTRRLKFSSFTKEMSVYGIQVLSMIQGLLRTGTYLATIKLAHGYQFIVPGAIEEIINRHMPFLEVFVERSQDSSTTSVLISGDSTRVRVISNQAGVMLDY